MSGRVKHLLLGKKDPYKHSDEEAQGQKRNKDLNDPPHSPRSPLSPGFFLMRPLLDHSKTNAHSSHAPRSSSSQQVITNTTMANLGGTTAPILPESERKVDLDSKTGEGTPAPKASMASSAGALSSPALGTDTPQERTRPSESRSHSQEGHFMNRVKASREKAQTMSGMAAKAIGEKGSKAWGKIKTKAKSAREPQLIVPQSQYLGNLKSRKTKLPPIDVWTMTLRDATLKTRVIKEINSESDAAAYWTPAVAFRCLQYLKVHGPQELGLYRVSGSTSVVDEMRADFISRHDVDISLNPPNDIHTVTSLLKGYFRALPEAILPAEIQKKVYEQCKDHPEVENPPQCFIDELSQLPPYNYYLLYTLFEHLSMVNQNSDVNKMNLSNLGMIFCSTLRIDRFCFNWLVGHWADCWQGCLTEKAELEKTDDEFRKKTYDDASDVQSPTPTFDTRSSTPSSLTPSSTGPHTPVPASLRSQDTPAQSPKLTELPKLTSSPAIGIACANLTYSQILQSVPSTPVPSTPYTGDDGEMMVDLASDIICEYVDASEETDNFEDVGKHEDNHMLVKNKGKEIDRRRISGEGVQTPRPHISVEETSKAYGVQKDAAIDVEQLEIDERHENSQLSEMKFEELSLNVGSSKGVASRPSCIQLPLPQVDIQEPLSVPDSLQLTLPPLAPVSPLMATIDHAKSD